MSLDLALLDMAAAMSDRVGISMSCMGLTLHRPSVV
jgi:hypothetical protein